MQLRRVVVSALLAATSVVVAGAAVAQPRRATARPSGGRCCAWRCPTAPGLPSRWAWTRPRGWCRWSPGSRTCRPGHGSAPSATTPAAASSWTTSSGPRRRGCGPPPSAAPAHRRHVRPRRARPRRQDGRAGAGERAGNRRLLDRGDPRRGRRRGHRRDELGAGPDRDVRQHVGDGQRGAHAGRHAGAGRRRRPPAHVPALHRLLQGLLRLRARVAGRRGPARAGPGRLGRDHHPAAGPPRGHADGRHRSRRQGDRPAGRAVLGRVPGQRRPRRRAGPAVRQPVRRPGPAPRPPAAPRLGRPRRHAPRGRSRLGPRDPGRRPLAVLRAQGHGPGPGPGRRVRHRRDHHGGRGDPGARGPARADPHTHDRDPGPGSDAAAGRRRAAGPAARADERAGHRGRQEVHRQRARDDRHQHDAERTCRSGWSSRAPAAGRP